MYSPELAFYGDWTELQKQRFDDVKYSTFLLPPGVLDTLVSNPVHERYLVDEKFIPLTGHCLVQQGVVTHQANLGTRKLPFEFDSDDEKADNQYVSDMMEEDYFDLTRNCTPPPAKKHCPLVLDPREISIERLIMCPCGIPSFLIINKLQTLNTQLTKFGSDDPLYLYCALADIFGSDAVPIHEKFTELNDIARAIDEASQLPDCSNLSTLINKLTQI